MAERLPRRGRGQGVGRDQGDADAQGRVVAGHAAVPRPSLALQPHPQRAGAQAAGGRQDRRQCRGGLQERGQGDRGRIRMAVPVARPDGAGLLNGRDQGRQGQVLDRLAEVALRADRPRVAARRAARERARDLADRPGFLRPQRCG